MKKSNILTVKQLTALFKVQVQKQEINTYISQKKEHDKC